MSRRKGIGLSVKLPSSENISALANGPPAPLPVRQVVQLPKLDDKHGSELLALVDAVIAEAKAQTGSVPIPVLQHFMAAVEAEFMPLNVRLTQNTIALERDQRGHPLPEDFSPLPDMEENQIAIMTQNLMNRLNDLKAVTRAARVKRNQTRDETTGKVRNAANYVIIATPHSASVRIAVPFTPVDDVRRGGCQRNSCECPVFRHPSSSGATPRGEVIAGELARRMDPSPRVAVCITCQHPAEFHQDLGHSVAAAFPASPALVSPRVDFPPTAIPSPSHIIREEDVTVQWDSLLGSGGHAKVYSGLFRQVMPVAIKIVPFGGGATELTHLQQEVDVLATHRHSRIVTLYGVTTLNAGYYALVMEKMNKGTVQDYLGTPELTWARILGIAIDSANALAFMHSLSPRIVHRDLKPANLCLREDRDGAWKCKVVDFGVAKSLPATPRANVVPNTPGVGTAAFMAPEVMKGGAYTSSLDVWSYGVILWCMVTGERPYQDCRSTEEVYAAVTAGGLSFPIPPQLDVPRPYRDLVAACLNLEDENKRPSFNRIIVELRHLRGDM